MIVMHKKAGCPHNPCELSTGLSTGQAEGPLDRTSKRALRSRLWERSYETTSTALSGSRGEPPAARAGAGHDPHRRGRPDPVARTLVVEGKPSRPVRPRRSGAGRARQDQLLEGWRHGKALRSSSPILIPSKSKSVSSP